jgi:CubicO group peptidase (beta-lactamase class C family)
VNYGQIESCRDAEGVLVISGGDVLVPWWSFTKTVLATAILRLVEDGRLSLDVRSPGEPYAVHQLLQHTAGLGDYGELGTYRAAVARNERAWQVAELLERAEASRLRYPPGAGWRYSNIGYLKLRQRIEAVTGHDLARSLAELIFEPMKMEATRVAMGPADLRDVEMGGKRGFDPRWVYHGLLVGPLDDATFFLQRLMDGTLLSQAMLAEMRTGHDLPQFASEVSIEPSYGLGLMLGKASPGFSVNGHAGGGPGSTVAIFGRQEEKGVVAAGVWRPYENGQETQAAVVRLLAAA